MLDRLYDTVKNEASKHAKPVKAIKITSPSGKVYRLTWQKKGEPTQADLDQALAKVKEMEGAASGLPPANVDPGTIAEAKRIREGGTHQYMTEKGGPVQTMDQHPMFAAVSKALGSIKGGAKTLGGDYQDPAAQLPVGEFAAALAATPARVGAEVGVLTAPDSALLERAGAIGNILAEVIGPVEAIAILKGGKSLSKSTVAIIKKKFGAEAAGKVQTAVKSRPVPKTETPTGPPPTVKKPGVKGSTEPPKASEPGATPGTSTKPLDERTKTSIALRESDRFHQRPDEPDPESLIEWAEKAKAAEYGTQAGAAKILKRFKETGVEPDKSEIVGLGARLADIQDQLRGMPEGPQRKALIDEAVDLRSIRSTETARALAARAALMHSDYSPGGIVAAVEIRTGKSLDPKRAKQYEKLASDYEAAKGRIGELEKELDALRVVPEDTSAKTGGSVWGKGSPKERMKAAQKELSDILGKMTAMVDPAIVKPIAKMVKAKIDELGGNIDRALKEVKNELKVGFGLEHSTDELWDAFKGARPKRNVTEDLIRKRRESARIAGAIRKRIADDEATWGVKTASKAVKASTEIKMWNPVARAIDQASNLDEVISASFTAPFERPIANLVLKLSKTDARYAKVAASDKPKMISRYISEVKDNVADAAGIAESGWQGGGPAGHFAGILDAPARSWHEITWAGERASALQKKHPGKFEDILDQIRDPEMQGPLAITDAKKLHQDMKDFGDVQMLTNNNWASIGRGMVKGGIRNHLPPALHPAGNLIVDFATQFSKVLVNVTDKTGQYANPYYALGRAVYELLPKAKGISADVRARTFAQIVRRGGVGMGLVQLGRWYYESDGKIPEGVPLFGGMQLPGKGRVASPLGPAIVETYNKKGNRTGNMYQDEGLIAMIGRMGAAFMVGYREAQIDASDVKDTQKQKMKRDLLYAPLNDNPVMGNLSRFMKMTDPGNILAGHSLQSWLLGLYYPGGLREWARIQDIQEGVHGRRADGPVEELQKKVPTISGAPAKLPPKAKKRFE